MAFLRLTSDNSNLSYVLQKNPASGLISRTLKGGMLFGYFPKKDEETILNQYCIVFKDSSDTVTYKAHEDEQFEYLNSSKYTNARFINDAIQEMLHTARENEQELDVPGKQSIFINVIETHHKTIDIFRRYFKELEFVEEMVSINAYRLTVSSVGDMTVSRLLKIINLFGMFATLNSDDYIYITSDMVKKYIRLCNAMDVPYFIKYLLKMRMVRSDVKFELFKEELDKSEKWKFNFKHGDSHLMRINWVKEVLPINASLVDIGTGIDFRYLKVLADKLALAGHKYYAIEIDADARERIKAGVRNRNLEDSVEIFESLDEFLLYYAGPLNRERVNVLCTEVLEHNEYAEAKKIFKKVVEEIDFYNFVVTVPNATFNQFYNMDGFRHDDHKWEATLDNVAELEKIALYDTNAKVHTEIHNVGDEVNDISVSWGLTINKM